jgi:DUF2075 family protein
MLAYSATKEQFLRDAPFIEDVVRDAVKNKLGFNASPSEISAWRNSLGNAMFHVMNSSEIPRDAGIAIEYRLNGRRFRLDFVVTGIDENNRHSVVIIELKQWSDVVFSDLNEHVRTVLGGNLVDTTHPSYQAWSYQSHLQQYNEFIYTNSVSVKSCAYLHNLKDASVIKAPVFQEAISKAPVFIHGELSELQKVISAQIRTGNGTQTIEAIESSPIKPSVMLADAVGNMLNGVEEFVLLDEQKTIFEKIMKLSDSKTKKVLIVRGGPGTGKSVIAINALAKLTGKRLAAKYITANAAPRNVFEAKLKPLVKGDLIKHLFGGSGSYTESVENEFDALIVDEAHRLRMKSGMFKNLGEDQTKEIIKAAKLSVFFIDEAQKITWSDVGEIAKIKQISADLDVETEILELKSQFRCSGSDDYIAWLDNSLGIGVKQDSYFSEDSFDFKIFDSPSELHAAIKKKNEINNKSRVVAGYCWDWISKSNKSLYDIAFSDFGYKAKWNLLEYGNEWIMNPNSISEVGCIHTCQGLEVDYVGVIVGMDLIYRNHHLITDPSARARTDKSLAGYKKERKVDPFIADSKADELIRNTYRTLLTRGMKGCYVYFQDSATAEYFKSILPKGDQN